MSACEPTPKFTIVSWQSCRRSRYPSPSQLDGHLLPVPSFKGFRVDDSQETIGPEVPRISAYIRRNQLGSFWTRVVPAGTLFVAKPSAEVRRRRAWPHMLGLTPLLSRLRAIPRTPRLVPTDSPRARYQGRALNAGRNIPQGFFGELGGPPGRRQTSRRVLALVDISTEVGPSRFRFDDYGTFCRYRSSSRSPRGTLRPPFLAETLWATRACLTSEVRTMHRVSDCEEPTATVSHRQHSAVDLEHWDMYTRLGGNSPATGGQPLVMSSAGAHGCRPSCPGCPHYASASLVRAVSGCPCADLSLATPASDAGDVGVPEKVGLRTIP